MIYFILGILLSCCNLIFADMEHHGGDDTILSEIEEAPLFVSLGSYCVPALTTKNCGCRKAAFPFDWLYSMDLDMVIEMIQDDFVHFFTPEYLLPSQDGQGLFHTYYHLELYHDGTGWGKEEHNSNMEILHSKFTRRIHRFKGLESFEGKVYFVRSSSYYSLDAGRIYPKKENLEITDEDAIRLNSILKHRFPNLDFKLIILNSHFREAVVIEKILFDEIMMARGPITMGASDAHCHFYRDLQKTDLFPHGTGLVWE